MKKPMKIKSCLTLISLLFLSFAAKAAVYHISAEQLIDMIDKQKSPLIVDVRTAEEFNVGHVKGAINIPYDKLAENSDQLNEYKNEHIVFYCRSGRRASIVYQALSPRGFEKMVDLKGHMIYWTQKKYPLEK